MNERIQKLIEQATTIEEHGWGASYEHFDKEKFAELIVRECATTCDNIGKEARKEWKAKYIPHDDGRSDGAWECEAAILEQFGVEE
jgi:hypothetical protein